MKNIEIVMIPVKDRQLAKAFYQKIGFKVTAEATDAHGDPWIQVGLPGCETTISLANFHAIICETDNIEKEVDELKRKGIEIGRIDPTPWGKFAWTKDPDGNGLCLHEKPKA